MVDALKMRPSQNLRDWLGRQVTVQVDRPLGSAHPRYPALIYPVNYGFVPGTCAADGSEIDAYVLDITGPVATFTGVCRAVVHRLNDVEDKLVVCPPQSQLSKSQIASAIHFQEKFFESDVLIQAD